MFLWRLWPHKNKYGGNQGKTDNGKDLGENKFFFGQSIDKILLDGFVAVFVGHHGDNDNGQKQLEQSRDIGVEMPDVREIENPLIGQVKLYRANIKFYGRNQRNGSEEHKIGDDQHLAGSIVPKFYEFYL